MPKQTVILKKCIKNGLSHPVATTEVLKPTQSIALSSLQKFLIPIDRFCQPRIEAKLSVPTEDRASFG